MQSTPRIRWAWVLICGLVSGLAQAQSVTHFVPAPTTGDLELRVLRRGLHENALELWPEKELGWLFVREEGTQRNYSLLAAQFAEPTLVRVEREQQGVALVGWDRSPRVESVRSSEIVDFIQQRSPSATLPQAVQALSARENWPVRRVESLSQLVGKPTAPGTSSAVATSKAGQRMELRPLIDPTSVLAGSDLAFRLSLPEGENSVLVARATHLPSAAVRPVEIAPEGMLRTKLDLTGPWMIEAHALRGAASTAGEELELLSVTLVFQLNSAPPLKEER